MPVQLLQYRQDESIACLPTELTQGHTILVYRPLTWFRVITIASIITPATLSVTLAPAPANVPIRFVPTVDFSNLNFVAGMPVAQYSDGVLANSSYYLYHSPSQNAKQVVGAVAAQNPILPITGPSPHSSYEIRFRGPSLSCANARSTTALQIQQNTIDYLNVTISLGDLDGCLQSPMHLAWFEHTNITTKVENKLPYPPTGTYGNITGQPAHVDPDAIFNNRPTDFYNSRGGFHSPVIP